MTVTNNVSSTICDYSTPNQHSNHSSSFLHKIVDYIHECIKKFAEYFKKTSSSPKAFVKETISFSPPIASTVLESMPEYVGVMTQFSQNFSAVKDIKNKKEKYIGGGGFGQVYEASAPIDSINSPGEKNVHRLHVIKRETISGDKKWVRKRKFEWLKRINYEKKYTKEFGLGVTQHRIRENAKFYFDAGLVSELLMPYGGVSLQSYIESMTKIDSSDVSICKSECDFITYIIWQILEQVSKMHEKGVIHGDIKPKNIVIDAEGKVRLIDFGAVQLTSKKSIQTFTAFYADRNMLDMSERNDFTQPEKFDSYSVGRTLEEMLGVRSKVPVQLEKLFAGLLETNYKKRLSVKEASRLDVFHPYHYDIAPLNEQHTSPYIFSYRMNKAHKKMVALELEKESASADLVKLEAEIKVQQEEFKKAQKGWRKLYVVDTEKCTMD